VVLVVGHLIERKDPVLALRAWARWSEAARCPTRLVVVGDGPLAESLRSEIGALGCGSEVLLVPRATPEDLSWWYAAADLLLLTSRREGRPNVVLEALAAGRPVLATDAGGTGELLRGLEGMLVQGRGERELAAGLARVLGARHDPAELRRHAGRFTWRSGLEALERCLAGAVAARQGRSSAP
jgi:glycosyltransferase involved in cell wall biosynthesis